MKTHLLFFLFISFRASRVIYNNPHDFPDFVSHLPNFTSEAFPISFSGFAPIDETKDSALFYWYFPALKEFSSNAPTLLWLNGGPATSTTYNIFVENGPLRFKENKDGGYSVYTIDEPGKPRSWTAFYNILFIDQPVGTGFGYTTTNSYPETQEEIAQNIWKALQYFLKIHPETVDTKWYFSGESYAGRFVPAITFWTLQYNDLIKAGKMEGTYINLQGMIVASGFILGVSQRVSSLESSQTANLLNPNQHKQAKTIVAECQQLSGMGKNYTSQANARCDDITIYIDAVSGVNAADLSIPSAILSKFGTPLNKYFNHKDVIKALHAENSKKEGVPFNASCKIAIQHLQSDRLSNSLGHVNYILNRIPCLFFSGNFDALDGSYGTYEWFEYLEGSYPEILTATRNIWYINKEAVGFYTEHKNLTYIIVNFAGHYIPFSQIDVTVKMVDIFTSKNNNWNYFSNLSQKPIPEIMSSFVKNCNGNGQITESGTCICNEGFGLADCSVQAQEFHNVQNYSLREREYLFLKVLLNGQDALIKFQNNEGTLEVFSSSSTQGPVVDHEEADGGILASKSIPKSRTLYLSSNGKKFGYLTVHNSNYLSLTNFTGSIIFIDPSSIKYQPKEYQNYFWGLNVSFISHFLYIASLIMILLSVVTLVKNKKIPEELPTETEVDLKKTLIL